MSFGSWGGRTYLVAAYTCTPIVTIPLDELSREQRENWPAASFWGVPVSALYWCDGKRNLAEVIRLTELEMGPQDFDFVGYFKFLQKRGYVEFAP